MWRVYWHEPQTICKICIEYGRKAQSLSREINNGGDHLVPNL